MADGKIYFTADTHFRHAKVIEFSKRPFASVEDMDAALLRNWRQTVTDEDVIYHLGDVAWKTDGPLLRGLRELPGTKHLVVGNHDHSAIFKLWTTVSNYVELSTELGVLILCHYPFAVWKNSHRGSVQLHGHSHGGFPASDQQMDVGVDCTDYRPISLEEVRTRLAGNSPHAHRDNHAPR